MSHRTLFAAHAAEPRESLRAMFWAVLSWLSWWFGQSVVWFGANLGAIGAFLSGLAAFMVALPRFLDWLERRRRTP